MMSRDNVILVDFPNAKRRFVMGCPECESTDWHVVIDTDVGEYSQENPEEEIDFECTGISCSECGFTIDMRGSSVH